MEQDILAALDYCVNVSTTTPMEYVRHSLELLSEWDGLGFGYVSLLGGMILFIGGYVL